MLKFCARNRTKNPLLFRALARVQVILEIFARNRTENPLCSRATARVLDMLKIFAHNRTKNPLFFRATARKKKEKILKLKIKKKNLNHHILSLILVDILSLNMLSVLKSFISGYLIKCFVE